MTGDPVVSRVVVDATRATAARWRCCRCLGSAHGAAMVVERRGSSAATYHDGPCPQSSGWGNPQITR